MIDFFLIVFFSKTILLTPNDIDLKSGIDYVRTLEEPISAITQGASVQIDVSKMIPTKENIGIVERRSLAKEVFPDGVVIEAKLTGKNGEVSLQYEGNVIVGNNMVRLKLSNVHIPTSVEYDKISLRSSVKLDKVRVYWKNYSK